MPNGVPRRISLALRFLAVLSGLAALASAAVPDGFIRIHYHRPDATYAGWTVYSWYDSAEPPDWGSGPVPVTGTDSYGAYFDVAVQPNPHNVGIIIHNGNNKDPGPNQFVNPALQGNEFWAISGVAQLYTVMPDVTQEPAKLLSGYARIHYYRPDGNYNNWTVYSWNSSAEPNDYNDGPKPVTGTDKYGAYFDVALIPNASELDFIIHNPATNVKDPGPNMALTDVTAHPEAWVISGDATVYTAQPGPAQILASGFSRLQAFWIDRHTFAIQPQFVQMGWTYALVSSASGQLQILDNGTLGPADSLTLTMAKGLTQEQLTRFPQLAGYAALTLPPGTPVTTLQNVLRGQTALAATDGQGALKYITGLQIAGVLDDLYAYDGPLGVRLAEGGVELSLWAPTAQSVSVLIYAGAHDTEAVAHMPLQEHNGVWTVKGEASWVGKYYLYDVRVYVPSLHKVVQNVVTDPYSTDLGLNGVKSRITDFHAQSNKPEGWDSDRSPALASKSDFSVYELHVRDFSVADASVPAEHRGTYLAFADRDSRGMQHLHELAQAGLKAVHLLPTFHFASVNEKKSTWKSPGDLSIYPPDSTEQQAKVTAVQSEDAYNWGYDPVHYMTPEGSYALNPDDRVKEYRQMVMGLHGAGLRVVQDLVFNHMNASGQAFNAILDRVVPTYYYRLDADGNVENGTCCSDTASEHKMMEKLMIDTVVHNAREYKIDGFRFDLMSFHFVYNMRHIQEALAKLTPNEDGVDGSKIYLYGEGWNFGETGNNQLGPNADQVNMYGTGIGTFNDRIRDGIRGGGPFSDPRVQGFATGLFTDPSAYMDSVQAEADQKTQLLLEGDWIRAGLAGNLRDFTFEDSTGTVRKASEMPYNGQGVGYTMQTLETVNYCSVHDNQTLFDAVQLKSPIPGTVSDGGDDINTRARRQVLALSMVALAQGIPFFHGGDDLLRSKDMDNNSYDSGDWFNKIDWTLQSANWGIGLPLASNNQSQWSFMAPLLQDPALAPAYEQINYTRNAFLELMRIRSSSRLFRMNTLHEVQGNLHFLNTGTAQIPGLIVVRLDANDGDYGPYKHIVVVFNATSAPVSYQSDSLKDLDLRLHPVQAQSHDPISKGAALNNATGTADVPGLTTTVFVSERQ